MPSATTTEAAMKSLFGSILSALKSGLAAVGRVLTWPLRALASIGGGGGGGIPELPEPHDPGEPYDAVADLEKKMTEGLLLANLLIVHCANSVVNDAPAMPPETLPQDLRDWAQGLSRAECDAILGADEKSISAHIRGLFALPGVRQVQPLPRAVWAPETSPEPVEAFAFSVPAAGL